MKAFENIIKRVHEKLIEEGITKFSLKDIEAIIWQRNFDLDLFKLDWINWDLIDDDKKGRKNRKAELEFREIAYESVMMGCKESKIFVTFDELDKIFRIEQKIVPHYRINYYDMEYTTFEKNSNIGKSVPFAEMDFKKKFRIFKWVNWKNTIDRAIRRFYEEFDILPNVLFANKHTLSQFNFLINLIPGEKDDVFRYDEATMLKLPVDDEEEIELSGYESGDCRLYFWFDQRMKDKTFILDYNDDYNWDDDDDDDDDDKDTILPDPTPKKSLVKMK
jgi:hypothetical protein